MNKYHHRLTRNTLLCVMFLFSGFCGLIYQTVWLRLAFAQFGVITPIISIVVSVFMLGLALGSWLVGKYIPFLKIGLTLSPIVLYGLVEFIIGAGAYAVPILFSWGAETLLGFQGISSWSYLLVSAVVIALCILPWTIAMGATYPIVLEFLRESPQTESRGFGMLYAANTAGAALGALLTIFVLIEIFGFKTTLALASIINFSIGLIAIIWGIKRGYHSNSTNEQSALDKQISISPKEKRRILAILFSTGLCLMAMEVIWIRCFSSLLGSFVYSFALLLVVYLVSNWFGACLYRLAPQKRTNHTQSILIIATAICACLPLLADNPQFIFWLTKSYWNMSLLADITLFSIAPLSLILGYLTPSLVDTISQGIPAKAGKAYAINMAGCILGPLLAGYIFLPLMGGAKSLIIFELPLLYFLITNPVAHPTIKGRQHLIAAFCTVILIFSTFTPSWEEIGPPNMAGNYRIEQIYRDYAATTTAGRMDGLKFLRVNGTAMTSLSQDTKFMAHLPLALHTKPPKSILVICFGMGTSFRSATTWNAKVTVVELLPSVVRAFNYFHSDANTVLSNPNNRIIIDDGRRFLKRSNEKFDVVIIDPPPPLETSASSLLYSEEFFNEVKNHLAPDGILMEWYGFPKSEAACLHALVRSIVKQFDYVHIYKALDERLIGGYFILCSEKPIKTLSVDEFIARLPGNAKHDLLEWINPKKNENRAEQLKGQVREILTNDFNPNRFLVQNPSIVITDDHPFNEYYLLRRKFKLII